MTADQIAIIVLMAALLVAFALDRFRIELVALAGLAIATALGLVPLGSVFEGFSSRAVITVAEILIIVQLLARSHLVDWLAQGLAARIRSERGVVVAVCCLGAGLSVFMNNIGALALMLPVAFSLCQSVGARVGSVVMPLSFATLLGGTCSLVGTPANLVASGVRQEVLGAPFSFFATGNIGLFAAIAGLAYLGVAAVPLLRGRGLDRQDKEIVGPRRFVAEFRVAAQSPLVGKSVRAAEEEIGGVVHAHLRDGRHVFGRRGTQLVAADDVLLAESDVVTAITLARKGEVGMRPSGTTRPDDEWVEAVVLPQSPIIGSAVGNVGAFERFGVEVVALSPQTTRIEGRLCDVTLSTSDVLLLHGDAQAIQAALAETDCLAISPRGLAAPEPEGWYSLAAFVAAIAAAASGLLPTEIAFGAAVLALSLSGILRLRAAIAELNWPILIMLAAMIPLGIAVETTGAATVVAQALLAWSGASGPVGVSLVLLVATLLITPFINNVSTAVALSPIAVAMARTAGVSPEPLLLIVAVGSSLDFMTPFGHHNNTLAMGLGGYRFRDFVRLGAPLTLVTGAAALGASLLWA